METLPALYSPKLAANENDPPSHLDLERENLPSKSNGIQPSPLRQSLVPSAAHTRTPRLHDVPPIVSPAFTPPTTPSSQSPVTWQILRGEPINSLDEEHGGCGEKRPKLLDALPKVECVARGRIPMTLGTGASECWLHVYSNDIDNKEHLAIVFDENIHSRSLFADRPGESEWDRMNRGAYDGRLYPGRSSSRLPQQQRQAQGFTSDSPNGITSTPVNPFPALVRIHSECYTGETAWSARCDCGEQLDEAARLMSLPTSQGGGGVIVYLRQEGRGIGLGEKLKAYNLQDLGSDTVQANLLLRHPADARSYGLATAMLVDLGLGGERGIRLLTNNPEKVRAVEGPNREVVVKEKVAMIPISWRTSGKAGVKSPELSQYLRTKIEKMGHTLQ